MDFENQPIRDIDIFKRAKILENCEFPIIKIIDQFLRRANSEVIDDEQAICLIDFLVSFECFEDLEHYYFYYYDPNSLEIWKEILDHIYKRSITSVYLMN